MYVCTYACVYIYIYIYIDRYADIQTHVFQGALQMLPGFGAGGLATVHTQYLKTTQFLWLEGFRLKRTSPHGNLKQETYRKRPVLIHLSPRHTPNTYSRRNTNPMSTKPLLRKARFIQFIRAFPGLRLADGARHDLGLPEHAQGLPAHPGLFSGIIIGIVRCP